MWELDWTLWRIAGAVALGAWPAVAVGHIVMTVKDHRLRRDWRMTGLAIAWPVCCVAEVGAVQGNMSPPLFGVPLLLLFLLVWRKPAGLFTAGVVAYYGLSSALVLYFLGGESEYNRWWFLAFWPISLALLILWRRTRMAERPTPAAVV